MSSVKTYKAIVTYAKTGERLSFTVDANNLPEACALVGEALVDKNVVKVIVSSI